MAQRPEGTFREAEDFAAGWKNLREQGAAPWKARRGVLESGDFFHCDMILGELTNSQVSGILESSIT